MSMRRDHQIERLRQLYLEQHEELQRLLQEEENAAKEYEARAYGTSPLETINPQSIIRDLSTSSWSSSSSSASSTASVGSVVSTTHLDDVVASPVPLHCPPLMPPQGAEYFPQREPLEARETKETVDNAVLAREAVASTDLFPLPNVVVCQVPPAIVSDVISDVLSNGEGGGHANESCYSTPLSTKGQKCKQPIDYFESPEALVAAVCEVPNTTSPRRVTDVTASHGASEILMESLMRQFSSLEGDETDSRLFVELNELRGIADIIAAFTLTKANIQCLIVMSMQMIDEVDLVVQVLNAQFSEILFELRGQLLRLGPLGQKSVHASRWRGSHRL